MDGHADRCATSIFDRVNDQIGDRPAQRERPGEYRGHPFTGVSHRAAGVGSILADCFDRGITLRPEFNSLTRLRAYTTWGNPRYKALREKTLDLGLRHAGMPEA